MIFTGVYTTLNNLENMPQFVWRGGIGKNTVRRGFEMAIERFAESCSGVVLDVGCGNKPYNSYFTDVGSYVGIDVQDTNQCDVIADALSLPFQTNAFDHVISTQVIEHIKNPFIFISELGRVLKPGGTALITTNQMYPLHEKPHDYYRFTRYGLRHIADSNGLAVGATHEFGSMFTRLGSEFKRGLDKLSPRVATISSPLINISTQVLKRLEYREDYVIVGVTVKNIDGK